MAQGIADIGDCLRMPYLIGATQTQFYQTYQEETFGTCHIFDRPDICWETESLKSLSEWGCDPGGPCCTCDCDCRPAPKSNAQPGEYFRTSQDNTAASYGNDKTSSSTHRMSKRYTGRGNKEDRKQGVHKDKKEKNKGDGSKNNKRGTSKRRSH
ncbi:uncharacterized protein BKA55DRAFT_535215 [Fusarium redolens]|uniref:Uncharacterized protein n=1 Tax=Fusarium redolens TaxID=48865 RepID=A0A9P9HWU1_FUSRE|nr:uncharacterized protein BKA55DRAFT_535215 [Fusarium redolens]KAH7265279.1 hypothetical protein BKA55DRAFT_535215 [Fusarium redolens]